VHRFAANLPIFAMIFAVFSPKHPPFIAGCKKIFYNNRKAIIIARSGATPDSLLSALADML
jgi:hypothetical protein